jgi:hypothetical protein
MGLLDDLKIELLGVKAVMEPELEGFKDFARLNINADTAAAISTADADFTRRLKLINEVITALDALKADGYPTLDTRTVSSAVYDDLKANAITIEAALAMFADNEAVKAVITPGVATEQPLAKLSARKR